MQCGIVQVQFVQCFVQVWVVFGIDWEQVGEYVWLYFLEVWQWFWCWIVGQGEGVVDWCIMYVFDVGGDLVYFIGMQCWQYFVFGSEYVDVVDLVVVVG